MPDLTNQQLLETLRQELITKDDIKSFATKEDLKAFATKEDIKNMATKDDLKQFATKDDLERFATKDDIKNMATKDDLERFASKDDFARLERKLDSHKDSSTQHHLKILEEIGHLNQRFTKVSESQDGLGKRFNKLRIVTE